MAWSEGIPGTVYGSICSGVAFWMHRMGGLGVPICLLNASGPAAGQQSRTIDVGCTLSTVGPQTEKSAMISVCTLGIWLKSFVG